MAMQISDKRWKYLLADVDILVFVDKGYILDKYRCIICRKVAIRLTVANCGHIFCTKCSIHILGKACPRCIFTQVTEAKIDAQYEVEMQTLKVKCKNKQNGCRSIISLRNYPAHQEFECLFCPKPLVQEVDLNQNSPEASKYVDVYMQQIKMSINGLTDKLDQNASDMKQLKNQLLLQTEAQQIFAKQINENFMAAENRLSNLLHNRSNKSNVENNELEEVSNLEAQNNEDLYEVDNQAFNFFWKIRNFSSLFMDETQHDKEVVLWSNIFENIDIGPSFKVKLIKRKNCNYLSIYLEWSNMITTISTHARKFTLFDQSEYSKKKHVIMWDMAPAKVNYGELAEQSFSFSNFVPISLLRNETKVYVKDDSVLIKTSIYPISVMYKNVVSKNGTLLWRVEHYSSKKLDEIKGRRRCLCSPSFYTSPEGWRVQTLLYLNGCDESRGKCISIYTHFVAGEFDNFLSFSENAFKIKIFLMDQSEAVEKQHVRATIMFPLYEFSLQHGSRDFVLQSKAEKATYLKNDTLLFKITVEIM